MQESRLWDRLYLKKITDIHVQPEIYVVPSSAIANIERDNPSGKKVVSLTELRNRSRSYKDKWEIFLG